MFFSDHLEMDGVDSNDGVTQDDGHHHHVFVSSSESEDESRDGLLKVTGGKVTSANLALTTGQQQIRSSPVMMPVGGQQNFAVMTNNNGKSDRPSARRMKQRSKEVSLGATRFEELYLLTDEVLGRGAYATVVTCINLLTRKEYAAKVIEKRPGHSRIRIIKEIELFHLCAGHPNIVQLIEYFEEDDKFYLVFEKMRGGSLLNRIQRKICFSEDEARHVVRDIAEALKFLHDKGIAHRDIKPENILCAKVDSLCPVKLCDLDLASKVVINHQHTNSVTTPELQSPVGSAEFMAPEVVDAFVGDSISYDKRCDLWSVGVILYIMLCGYPPFYGECSRADCGWNNGLYCSDCQETLFSRIQTGHYNFPEDDWRGKSEEAIDLIRHLLTRNVNRRYTVDELLRHRFLNPEIAKSPAVYSIPRGDDICDLQDEFAGMNGLSISGGGGTGHHHHHNRLAQPVPVWISVPSNRSYSKQQWND